MSACRHANSWFLVIALLGELLGGTTKVQAAESVKVVEEVAAQAPGGLYVPNRPPLQPSGLMKLPIGSIKPKGWLLHQLQAEARGMTGRLPEISQWCKFEGNAWTDPKGKGHSGWEELPYWLKGFGDLGYVLGDERIITEARRWIEAVLAGQEADGWFGPLGLKTSLEGKPDLWPHMVMLNVLQSYYEYTADKRILPFMSKYFRWQLGVPEPDFMAGYWPRMRIGDNIESVYWLYNRTGEKWLLDLAAKIHRRGANWTDGIPDWHGVNLSQGFREPGVYFLQTKEKKYLDAAERNYQTVMGLYGQYPGGGFGADETCRKGYTDPHQGFETCSIVEFMHSFEMLTCISGRPVWADRYEELAFNSLPAALTSDQKALHYLTGANMVRLDKDNHAPGIQNNGTMLSYSPFAVYRCCQHNVSHGWPYYAEELFLATADNGLCASLYAACEVRAKVGDGTALRLVEETDYPFSDTIRMKIAAPKAVRFPLYLRVPRWCRKPVVDVNQQALKTGAGSLSYVVVDREWKDGDVVTLRLPMELGLRVWKKNRDAVSVDYGPLSFSLKIGEKYVRYSGRADWPELEVLPTTPWNYGLVLDAKDPTASLELVRKEGALSEQPFTPETVPLQVKARAKKIPGWTLDRNGLAGRLRPSPVRSAAPEEWVTLIPMGAARLRITAFPTIGSGPDAHDWVDVNAVKASASHIFHGDTIDALDDGLLPSNSSDDSIPRFTWWDHKGRPKAIDNTSEWVQYDFPRPRRVKSAEVYWFDDEPKKGGCRTPASWRLLYRKDGRWQEVGHPSGYGVEKDRFNRVTFDPVETSAIRLEVKLRPGFSGGILEWKLD
jgi:hypothetical protein